MDGATRPKYRIVSYRRGISVSVFFSGGIRNTAAALDVLRTRVFVESAGDRREHPNVAVVFLHARSADETATARAASLARRQGITLLVVGVTDNVRATELESIASYPARYNVFRIPNYYSFVNIHDGLTRAACNRTCLD